MALAVMDMLSPTLRASEGPLPAYRRLLAEGDLAADPAQQLAAARLQDLWIKLRGYDPPPLAPEGGFLSRLLRRKPTEEAGEDRPNGLYLVGEVGRGKSMLMDLFFAAAEVSRKRRIHFHRFMQEAHARIFAWKRANPDGDDPIPPLADAHGGRGGAALLRRVPGQRHRRRDDPRPAVRGVVRAPRRHGRDVQHGARTICSRASPAGTPSCRSSRSSSSAWTCW